MEWYNLVKYYLILGSGWQIINLTGTHWINIILQCFLSSIILLKSWLLYTKAHHSLLQWEHFNTFHFLKSSYLQERHRIDFLACIKNYLLLLMLWYQWENVDCIFLLAEKLTTSNASPLPPLLEDLPLRCTCLFRSKSC